METSTNPKQSSKANRYLILIVGFALIGYIIYDYSEKQSKYKEYLSEWGVKSYSEMNEKYGAYYKPEEPDVFWRILACVAVLFAMLKLSVKSFTADDRVNDPEKYRAIDAANAQKMQSIQEVTGRLRIKAEYFIGHPSINNPEIVYISLHDKNIEMYVAEKPLESYKEVPQIIATIPLNAVKDIAIEDQSTVERKISAGRLLLVGAYALAWKKKTVHEAAYVIITWADGRFAHETYFRKEGKGAVAEMNTARNTLIQWVNRSEQAA